MHEPLTLELTVDVLRDLSAAFPQKMDDKQMVQRAEIYRNNLDGLSGSALRWAAKASIREDSFFPKVARLRELAQQWTVANAPARVSLPGTPTECVCCHQRFEWRKAWRPMVTLNGWGHVVTSADGQWLMLASYERSRCACDPPSPYFPDIAAPTNEPAMRLFNDNGAPLVSRSLMERIAEDAKRQRRAVPEPLSPALPTDGRAA